MCSWEGYRPQLFDMAADPLELTDLGDDPAYAAIRADLHERLFAWAQGTAHPHHAFR